jgi:hypothetical protein
MNAPRSFNPVNVSFLTKYLPWQFKSNRLYSESMNRANEVVRFGHKRSITGVRTHTAWKEKNGQSFH